MNKKVIERILKNLLENDTYTIEKEENEILLNYIADLQKEVEILKRPMIENWEKARTIKAKCRAQQRIDKAIEYIHELLNEEFVIEDAESMYYGEKCQRSYFSDSELGQVLNILEKGE